jgi:hypothetical protein
MGILIGERLRTYGHSYRIVLEAYGSFDNIALEDI